MPGYNGPTEARRAASRRDYAKNREKRKAAVAARYREGLGGMTKREAKAAKTPYLMSNPGRARLAPTALEARHASKFAMVSKSVEDTGAPSPAHALPPSHETAR